MTNLDTEIATLLGIDLKPSREYTMARVAWRYITGTGHEFIVHINDQTRYISVPPGKELRHPEGSDYWNDRYALYVAEQLGDDIAAEVDAYRIDPPPYSSDLTVALQLFRQVTEKISETTGSVTILDGLRGEVYIDFPIGDGFFGNAECAFSDFLVNGPLAIAKACCTALKAI